jgi:hypothetical protein
MPAKKNTKALAAAAKALTAAAAPGPAWSNNNMACLAVWTIYSQKVLGQHDDPFEDVGGLKIGDLPFFNKVPTIGNQVLEAEAMADMTVKYCQHPLGADFESGQNYASAVLALTEILKDKTKTLNDLAAVVDEMMAFPIENFI